MINWAFRHLLTFNATGLLLIVFCVQKSYTMQTMFPEWEVAQKVSPWWSYLSYLAALFALTRLSLLLCKWLAKSGIEQGRIIQISNANNSFLPSYLAYFFVALSVDTTESLVFVYGLIYVFTYFSQALYFNPIFLVFGFHFYNITTVNGARVFLISREQYKTPEQVHFDDGRRVTDYTIIRDERWDT